MVRGFCKSDSTVGTSKSAPAAQPMTVSSASVPNRLRVMWYLRAAHMQIKYSTRNTACPAKKK